MKQELKVAVVNLQSGIGTTRGYWEYLSSAWRYLLPSPPEPVEIAGETLRREGVDIALLTEINEVSYRSRTSQVAAIERYFETAYTSFFPTVRRGRIVHEGNAIVSRFPIIESSSHLLPSFTIPRYLGETTVRIGETETHVFVAHLSLAASRRKKQLRAIAGIIGNKERPIILGGDFNSRDAGFLESLLHVGLATICSEKNYPSWSPKHSLDYLLLSRHFEAKSCYVPDSRRFSDHAPIIVEAELSC